MTRLRDIGEDALIDRLVRLVPLDGELEAGPGDDCAVIDAGGPELTLLKTDALVERVHFSPEAPARAVGWKAAARVVSDFAAMGGRPERFLVTLALRGDMAVEWAEDLYRGFGECLKRCGGVVAGGETSAVPEDSAAVISVAATGRVRREYLVQRRGGKPGDRVMVTGALGGSIHGKHLDFMPRLRESAWLVERFKPRAMMDLSDGLAKDLPRLAAASGCGFRIDESALPITPGCTAAEAIGDGEDYELLFALAPDHHDALLAAWPADFSPLAAIGFLTAAPSGELTGGWEHFTGT